MVHVLVSLTAADAVDGSARQVEGVLRRLPESGQSASTGPNHPVADGLPFSGWLELLGHLERLIAPGPQVADPIETGGGHPVQPSAAAGPVPATALPGES
ncbi:hypothetical protein [Blastococcus capsensis]|uniref:hypothetical protein n=1 Tax=Blastococcus capsensis TaxID=1564163 RepID=UPI0025406FD1|nr:hypothetical protein [Blastococcus capsensis]MDK3256906.1 hypothetical protein [Blastococcus capsensis]